MRPNSKPCAARATVCSPTSPTSSARRSRHSSPRSSCCAMACDTMQPEAREKLVASLERGTLRLTRLIDNLLESVRIESGQLSHPAARAWTLPEVIEDAQALVELAARCSASRRSRGGAARGAAAGRGDKTRLTQVFVNLIANANKFSPDGSVLRIGADRSMRHQVEAWVEDEGPGPADGDASSVFRTLSARRGYRAGTRWPGAGPVDRQVRHRTPRWHDRRSAHAAASHPLQLYTARSARKPLERMI
jgi:signal transduction histidine kinase